jgi:hypothetical protein
MPKSNVTGRDGHIMRKALAYAIEAIGKLPLQWQEASDREDMVLLLGAMGDGDHHRMVARGHLERRGTTVTGGRVVVREPDPGIVVPLDVGH